MEFKENELFHERYRLLEMKGRGSFGEVWLAEDDELDMKVAIKIYVALDVQGLSDFKQEFKTVYDLNHPNLLHAYHYDVFGQRPYLVMPYCPSSSLEMIGCADEEKVLKFIADVGSGLKYLHSQGIVHRDIKPDNVLISEEGRFLITDFGISLRMRSTLRRNSKRDSSSSGSGAAGTIGYMAPELFTSEPSSVYATDVWALSAAAYELYTGELPFMGQGGVMQLHEAEIPQIPGASSSFNQLLKRGMAKETWERPSAGEMSDYAGEILEGKTPSMGNTGGIDNLTAGGFVRNIHAHLKVVCIAVVLAIAVIGLPIVLHHGAVRRARVEAVILEADILVKKSAVKTDKCDSLLMEAYGIYEEAEKKPLISGRREEVRAKMQEIAGSLDSLETIFTGKASKMREYGEADAAAAFTERASAIDKFLKDKLYGNEKD